MLISGVISLALAASITRVEARELFDERRNRAVPTEIMLPARDSACTSAHKCKVALLSPGYGLGPGDYRFLAAHLGSLGYMVVSIQSVLPNDPKSPDTGNIIADRTPMWQRGVDNLHFVRRALATEYPQYDWDGLTLVGHSNGGDLSALALSQDPTFAKAIVTLDNRRYPLPRSGGIQVLSIRGSDFPADAGVLPEVRKAGSCIAAIPESRHNDMNDKGPAWLKSRINHLISEFLLHGRCNT